MISKIEKRITRQLIQHEELSKYIPDEFYLNMVFRTYLDQNINFKNPTTFNEKIQWLKLFNRNPQFTRLVDKYEAKIAVSEILDEEYTIPTLGVWDKFDDIDFSALPEQFVLKCTHDSGGLVICRDKSALDLSSAREKINTSLHNNFYNKFREWAYKDVKPRIIAESYMSDDKQDSLIDYKFFCFNGSPEFLYISEGLENHSTAKISFCDLDGKLLPFYRKDYDTFTEDVKLPTIFPQMVQVAKKLAQGIDTPFVRIDLYEISGKVYFSEVTFYPNGGLIPFEPKEWDTKLGAYLNLDI